MLSVDRLKELLHYDSPTGVFVWKKSTSQRNAKGKVAGFLSRGYVKVGIDGVDYLAHRLAWLYVYEYWPKNIDHINRDRSDNRISNLREANQSINVINASSRTDNTSGMRGVSWAKNVKLWHAYLNLKGKRVESGHFKDFFEACCARRRWENIYGFSKIRYEV